MEYWEILLIAGVVLLAAEIAVPGFILGAIGISLCFTGLCALFGLGPIPLLIIFSITLLISFLLLRPFVKKYLYRKNEMKTNSDAFTGRTAKVTKRIEGNTSIGSVKLDGVEWQAKASDETVIEVGEDVVIERTESIILIVNKK